MRIDFSGRAHRHTPERLGPLEALGVPAPNEGRYHRLGEPRPLYASTTRAAAWKECARRLARPLLRLGGHRMSTLLIREAPLLDLNDLHVLEELRVTRQDLLNDEDLMLTQRLAQWARDEGLAGVIAPSAADPEDPAAATIVIFADHLDRVSVEHESVEPFPEELLE